MAVARGSVGGDKKLSTRLRNWRDSGFVWSVLLVVALIVGIFLRCYQISTQILLDDEWHAINELLHADAWQIATHFGVADYSIPLTLYDKFLYLHGGLSEWSMRAPMLITGIGILFLAPWLLRRMAKPATLAVWVGLMAISPVLVYLTRTARPYAITDLLCFVAIIAFREWWHGAPARKRWAGLYLGCTLLAGWLHLITLPFTLMPFVFFGIATLRDGFTSGWSDVWRRIGALLLLGVLIAVPLVAVLLPPILGDWASLAGKAGSGTVTLDSVYRTAQMAFGLGDPWSFSAVLVLLAVGVVAWWRRDAGFVGYVGAIILVSAAAIAASHPAWVQNPGVYTRYMQPAIPFLLLFTAQGVTTICQRLPALVHGLLAVALICALYLVGPIPGYLYNPNQFMGHPFFQFDYDPDRNVFFTVLPPVQVPAFYHALAALPPRSLTLIESPWTILTYFDPQPMYQRVHRQYVRIGILSPLCGPPAYGEFPPHGGMQLSQFVNISDVLDGASSYGDLLIVHLQHWPPNAGPAWHWPDVPACLARIEQTLGAPDYHDKQVVVFALSPRGRSDLSALGLKN